MNKKSIIAIVIVAVLLVTGYLVWKNQSFNQNNSNTSNPTGSMTKIGVILPLTGPVAEPGTNALNGIKIAVDRFNNSNNDKKIQLIVEDSKSSPKDGVSAIQKLIDIDKTKIIIGDLMSSVFLATAPIAENNKVTMISPGASSPEVRNAGNYIFRNYPSDEYDGEVMANYVFNKLGKQSTVIVYSNNDYGIGVANRFNQVYTSLGGKIPQSISYNEGQTDFKTIVSKIKSVGGDMIYVVGNPAENGHLVNELKVQNVKIPVSGNLSFENETFLKVAKGSFDTIYFSSLYFNLDKQDDYTQYFAKTYQERHGKKPDVAAALGYDVAMILIQTLQQTDFDTSKINDALYNLKDFEGITGKTNFDQYGDVKKSIFIKMIKGDGAINTVELFEP
jgi:branched-chain amino acid transport system substrate-binding protein